MEAELTSLLNRQVTFRTTASRDMYGQPSYNSVTVSARIDSSRPTSWDDKGNVTSMSGTIWCEVTENISIDSRVLIDGITAKVTNYKLVYDDVGPHHMKVDFA